MNHFFSQIFIAHQLLIALCARLLGGQCMNSKSIKKKVKMAQCFISDDFLLFKYSLEDYLPLFLKKIISFTDYSLLGNQAPSKQYTKKIKALLTILLQFIIPQFHRKSTRLIFIQKLSKLSCCTRIPKHRKICHALRRNQCSKIYNRTSEFETGSMIDILNRTRKLEM